MRALRFRKTGRPHAELGATIETTDTETRDLVLTYLDRFELRSYPLRVTTERSTFEGWIGRRAGSAIGGAYCRLGRTGDHAILINLRRIDRSQARAVEIVVAEELLHMRDAIDGDHRRHAKHGFDRIAFRVAEVTGCSLAEIRGCLVPATRRPFRWLYQCPACAMTIKRRRRGRWSCARCSSRFERRFELKLIGELMVDAGSNAEP